MASRLQSRPSLGLESQACVSWHRICRYLNGEYVLYLPINNLTSFSGGLRHHLLFTACLSLLDRTALDANYSVP